MATIALANRNPASIHRTVIIDLMTKQCTFPNNQRKTLQQVLLDLDFSHPLLTAPVIKPLDGVCHYQYDTLDGLLCSGLYVYATLLQSDDPKACYFKINPSAKFSRTPVVDELYFSPHRQKRAKHTISIRSFTALVQYFFGPGFEFSEDLIMAEEFTFGDLPHFIHGDALYYRNHDVFEALSRPRDVNRFEVRYISEFMGFGLFCRERVLKGEVLFHYAGLKIIHKPQTNAYVFQSELDCFDMLIDARSSGNLARFVNHAPKVNIKRNSPLLRANIKAMGHCLNGVEVVLFKAKKDIMEGEQFLVDYGRDYFNHLKPLHLKPLHLKPLRFKPNGQIVVTNIKERRFARKKTLNLLRVMAQNGVKEAQEYLSIRIVVISLAVLFVMVCADYFS